MILDRRNVLKILPAAASVAIANPSLLAETQKRSAVLNIEPPAAPSLSPLQKAVLHVSSSAWETGTIVLLDGAGREYLRAKASAAFPFVIGGALGMQTARLLDAHGAVAAELEFLVDCSTQLNDEGGLYRSLLESLVWTMASWDRDNPVSTLHYKDRVYQFFANWVFDHTLIMKGMKYYWPDLKDAIDFFAATQREDGRSGKTAIPKRPITTGLIGNSTTAISCAELTTAFCSCAAPRWKATSNSISSRAFMTPGRPPVIPMDEGQARYRHPGGAPGDKESLPLVAKI